MTTIDSSAQTFDPLRINRAAASRERRIRAAKLVGGVLLIAAGARRRRLFGLLMTGYGLELLSDGLTGRTLTAQIANAWRQLVAPSRRFGDGTRDRVDEASWESFPASDASGAP